MTKTKPPVDALLTELGKVSGQIHVLDEDRDEMIRAARAAGASWEKIGDAMGVSKQAAWERYRHLTPPS